MVKLKHGDSQRLTLSMIPKGLNPAGITMRVERLVEKRTSLILWKRVSYHVNFCFSVFYQGYPAVLDGFGIICYRLLSSAINCYLLLPICYQSVTKIFQRAKW